MGEPRTSSGPVAVPTQTADGYYNTIAVEFDNAFGDSTGMHAPLQLEPLPFPEATSAELPVRPSNKLPSPEYRPATTPMSFAAPARPTYPRNTCRVCPKTFKTSELLEQHAKSSFHRVYVCPVAGCDRSYYRRDVYIRHKSTHRQKDLHVCYICAREGQGKAFKRKDHLTQHLRKCHASLDCPQLDWAFVGYPQSDASVDVLTRCDSPFDMLMYGAGVETGREKVYETPASPSSHRGCVGGFAAHDNTAYRSQAVADIEYALTAIVGNGSDELRVLKKQLDLHNGSTTEHLAWKLRTLVIRPDNRTDYVDTRYSPVR